MVFKVDVKEQQEGIYIVKPEGRLDADTYISLEEKIKPLFAPSTKVLVFDMSELDYISSNGVGVIFQAKKAIEENKGTFIMTNLQPQIRKIFQIVKALPEKPVFENMEEVDRYLDLMQKKEIEKGDEPSEI
ncbi:MAG: anti-sigma factor antagonist [Candidatus Makaraimicrobium thalassicum]|nr:MAG: anti-sigma factor antagonist [Candidatus Omnitrophota bacterium]